jgi:signal transduction histidine kinase
MRKVLGEAIDGLSRWYIAIPIILLIGFLLGLFLLAVAGQARLENANERVHLSQLRQNALGDFLSLITDMESAERGYLLTADHAYLSPYQRAAPKIEPALEQLRLAYADSGASMNSIRRLRTLAGQKVGEMDATIALADARGMTRAVEVVRTDVGHRTMDELRKTAADLRRTETIELENANSGLRSDLKLSRWLTAAGAVLNVVLVLVASQLVLVEMRRRVRQEADLRDQKMELENQVETRTQELAALSTHLQEISEQEKSALSRELHDELGGLLISARMDLSWIQKRLQVSDPAIQQRFQRIHESLSSGVDLKRRVVEELRPTLLDNMGLFAALRWQVKSAAARSAANCTESYPEEEMRFTPQASIGIFRTVQESLTNILKHAQAKSIDLTVEIINDYLIVRISDDGKGLPEHRLQAIGSHGLASMRHRITALGGQWDISSRNGGGTEIMVRIPLSRIVMKETETEDSPAVQQSPA